MVASHIVPWSESTEEERLDVNNGILLSPLYDALFDKHLISFADNGSIIISNKISHEMENLNIDTEGKITVEEEMKPFLSKHRNRLKGTGHV